MQAGKATGVVTISGAALAVGSGDQGEKSATKKEGYRRFPVPSLALCVFGCRWVSRQNIQRYRDAFARIYKKQQRRKIAVAVLFFRCLPVQALPVTSPATLAALILC